ncbi:MAG: FAD-dependent oxidoreductase, partial [bacterium]
ITLAESGLSVLILEAKDFAGGGLRTAELTESGFLHDICSVLHPLAVASPLFQKLALSDHGLEWIDPAYWRARRRDRPGRRTSE